MVSGETAKGMAERVRSLGRTTYSLSTTGNLGPELLEEKEKGLIFIAVSSGRGTEVKEVRLNGNRSEIKEAAAAAALEFLLKTVGKNG
jgi:nicotinamide mononucleotide (NMN) deamidase PncC